MSASQKSDKTDPTSPSDPHQHDAHEVAVPSALAQAHMALVGSDNIDRREMVCRGGISRVSRVSRISRISSHFPTG